jgi:hypothetical protein
MITCLYLNKMFTIYVFNSSLASEIIKNFENENIQTFYDDIHSRDIGWLKKQLNNVDHRLYIRTFGDQIIDIKIEDFKDDVINSHELLFFVVYNDFSDWDKLLKFLRYIHEDIYYDSDVEYIDKLIPRIKKQKIELDKIGYTENLDGKVIKSMPPEYDDIKDCYTFKYEYIENKDIMVYQVTRPGTNLPYCVVVYNHQKHGHNNFFTDIYGDPTWDINRRECRFDYTFLQKVWETLELPGKFDIQLVKERIKKCYPGRIKEGLTPESEPIIYRQNIKDVLSKLKKLSL